MKKPEHFTTSITCVKCGQEGSIIWEKDEKSRKSILVISDGFYRRVRGNHSAIPSVICDSCGAVLKNWALSSSGDPADADAKPS